MRVYLSHPIRGAKGSKATDADIQHNNDLAHEFANRIRCIFTELDIYVPGEHDEFVTIAYRKGYLTETHILDVDCVIVDRCEFVIAFIPGGHTSRGMQIEIEHARRKNIPVVFTEGYTTDAILSIQTCLEEI